LIASCGIAPGRYQAILPTFVSGWDPTALKAGLTFGIPEQGALTAPETAPERRYALRAVKQRLHQASFREAVITAYSGRCALSGLPEPLNGALCVAASFLAGDPVFHRNQSTGVGMR
jgi:putative restriction endonuclease